MIKDFAGQLVRAARLDKNVYEEVEANRAALLSAAVVVMLSALGAGIGVLGDENMGSPGLLTTVFHGLLGWVVWAALVWLVGTKILPEPQTKAPLGEILRTTGYARSPGTIRVIGIIPGTAKVVFSIAVVWMIVASVVAVRQALDYTSTVRAVVVCVLSSLIQALVTILLLYLLGGPALVA